MWGAAVWADPGALAAPVLAAEKVVDSGCRKMRVIGPSEAGAGLGEGVVQACDGLAVDGAVGGGVEVTGEED